MPDLDAKKVLVFSLQPPEGQPSGGGKHLACWKYADSQNEVILNLSSLTQLVSGADLNNGFQQSGVSIFFQYNISEKLVKEWAVVFAKVKNWTPLTALPEPWTAT